MRTPESLTELDQELFQVETEIFKDSLYDYVEHAWPVIDPEPFLPNWHIETVCYYLEALTAREINNVVFNLPPGLAKSLLVAVMWPTWEWTKRPQERYLFSAYGMDLSTRDTKRSRDLIRSDWYQDRFSKAYELDPTQDTKTYFENDHKGFRKATAVGASTTGARGKTLVLDDPHKLEEFYYPEQMLSAVNHKNEVLGTRGSGKDVRKIVMMQRVGPLDVTADIMEKMEQGGEHYEMLVLPMRYEPSVQLDMMKYNRIPWHDVDPRKEEGELLHPNLFGEREVLNLEINLLERADTVLQQRRSSPGLGIFQREWWDLTTKPWTRFDINDGATKNKVFERYLFFDTAYEDKDSSSYTGCAVLEVMEGSYEACLREVTRERVHFPDLLSHIEEIAERWNGDGLLQEIVIENRASGISAVQTLRRTAPGWLADRIVAFAPPGSKDEKCRQAAVYCKAGVARLPLPSPDADWLTWFLEEDLLQVPAAKFRDASDAFALGLLYLENFLTEASAVRGFAVA